MTQIFQIHPQNPQVRLVRQVVDVLNKGGVIVYPTDSAYALGCQIGAKDAMERIRTIRDLDKNHNFTLICRNLSEIATYAYVDNNVFHMIRGHTPGPYTFILQATKDVPRRLMHPKKKTIGIRVPDNEIVKILLDELGSPLMSVTLILPGEEQPVSDPNMLPSDVLRQVDIVIDGGFCGIDPTTVVDFLDGNPKIARYGKGIADDFL